MRILGAADQKFDHHYDDPNRFRFAWALTCCWFAIMLLPALPLEMMLLARERARFREARR